MVKEEEKKITNRIALIALLSAIVFGTISIYGNQKFDIVGYSEIAKLTITVVSKSLIIPLILFIIYIIGLSMDYRYASQKTKKWYAPFYDLGTVLSFCILIFTFIIIVVLKLAIYFNSPDIAVYLIWAGFMITAIFLGEDIAHPLIAIACIVIDTLKQSIKKILAYF